MWTKIGDKRFTNGHVKELDGYIVLAKKINDKYFNAVTGQEIFPQYEWIEYAGNAQEISEVI